MKSIKNLLGVLVLPTLILAGTNGLAQADVVYFQFDPVGFFNYKLASDGFSTAGGMFKLHRHWDLDMYRSWDPSQSSMVNGFKNSLGSGEGIGVFAIMLDPSPPVSSNLSAWGQTLTVSSIGTPTAPAGWTTYNWQDGGYWHAMWIADDSSHFIRPGASSENFGFSLATNESVTLGSNYTFWFGERNYTGYPAVQFDAFPGGFASDPADSGFEATLSLMAGILGPGTIVLQGLPDGSSTTVAFGRVISGSTPKQDVVLQNLGDARAYNATLAGKALVAHGSGATPGNTNISNQAINGYSKDTLSVGLDTTASGPWNSGNTITIHNTLNGSDNDDTVSVTGTVVANRVVTATSADFGFVHAGAPVGQPITLSTTSGDDNHATRVTVANVGPDANGISVTGGSNPTFNDNSVTDSRSVGGTFSTLGTKSETLTLTTTGEGLSGESPVNPTVSYTASVYSGKAQWNLGGSGSWSTHTNWKDTQVGGPNGGAPGVSGVSGDTATFGSIISAASTVTLDAPATLSAIQFDSTHAYTLGGLSPSTLTLQAAPGVHAVIDVVSAGTDSHVISAPMLFGSPLDISNNTAGTLTFAGALQILGGNVVTKTGSGTLIINGPQSWGAGSVLQVGGSGGSSPEIVGAYSMGSVPEPPALMTLAAGGLCLLGYAWRRRKREPL